MPRLAALVTAGTAERSKRSRREKKANAIIAELRTGKMSKAADLVEQTVYETLTYYAFPDIH
jgi:putative transposase